MRLGREAVLATGASEDEADETMNLVRRHDTERLALEAVGGKFAGRALLLGRARERSEA